MNTYKVKKGKHLFYKTSFPWLPRLCFVRDIERKIFTVDFELTSKSFYEMPLPDGTYDKDWADWNIKIAPHSFGTPFNKDAIMAAARCNPHTRLFELTCYSNNDYGYRAGTDEGEVMLAVPAGKYRWTAFVLEDGVSWKMELSGFVNNEWVYVQTIHTMRKAFDFMVLAPDWFGGANNEKGEYGGVAPQDLLIRINSKKK